MVPSLPSESQGCQPKMLAILLLKARSRNHVNIGLSPVSKGSFGALTSGKSGFRNSDWWIADPRGMERRQSTIGSLPGFLQIKPDIGVGLWGFECLLWDPQDMLDQGAA